MHSSFARKIAFFLWILTLAALWAHPAPAQTATNWMENEHGRVRLVAESLTTGRDGTLYAGLHFQMQPGWHIYWRTAGDAGYPPRIDWTGSQNLESATMEWPTPVRFSISGIETAGYKDEVVIPIQLKFKDPEQGAILQANLDYLTCKELCVPFKYQLSLTLYPGIKMSGTETDLIKFYRDLVPDNGTRSLMGIEAVYLGGKSDAPVLEIVARNVAAFIQPDVFIESKLPLAFSKPEVKVGNDYRQSILSVRVTSSDPAVYKQLAAEPLTITLTDGSKGMEQTITATKKVSNSALRYIAWVVFLGFVGGVILNFMPCVLPVLSIKLMQLTQHHEYTRAEIKRGFFATALGILASFWVLAGAASLLKLAGQQVGWGIQFQQPVFLIAMIAILLVFAANMWGLFEIRLPGFVSRLGRVGQNRSLSGEFLTGALATLLATPCSAPFLGTALGFALSQGTAQIFLIFTAVGLGLALPYFLVILFPGFVRVLPKPGHWMDILRKILALFLLATALWLASIVVMQLKPAAPSRPALPGKQKQLKQSELNWQQFSPEKIQSNLAEGKIVFVDITADWCLTCKANEKLVLNTEEARNMLNKDNIALLRGDWTRPDMMIATYLASFGRYGIPFNAIYSKKIPDGKTLPELLTLSIVEDAIKNAI